MPDFPIVDSHVHFWDREIVPLSWPAGSAIDRPHGPEDFDAQGGGVAVDAIVFVEAAVDEGGHLDEVAFVSRLAAADPRIQAIVARAPLDTPGVGQDLVALAQNPLVRGVRHLIQDKDADTLTQNPAFREGLSEAARQGFHFEICILHHQFAPVLQLIEDHPDVTFVLDHIGKPGIKAGVRDPWWGQIAAAAQASNVTCKLSGVVTEADHGAWRAADVRPYMDRVIDVFGPKRIMFGSDWPVMRLATDYRRWVSLVDEALAGTSAQDRRAVFADNARRLYRL